MDITQFLSIRDILNRIGGISGTPAPPIYPNIPGATPPFTDPGMSATSPTFQTGSSYPKVDENLSITAQPSTQTGQTGDITTGANSVTDRLLAGLSPTSDVVFDQFVNQINSMPRREDYQPSALRRVGAAIVGMGNRPAGMWGGNPVGYVRDPEAAKEADTFLNTPYYQAIADWDAKIKPTQAAAQLENQKNINERQLLYQTVMARLREESDAAKAAKDEKMAEATMIRAQAYKWKVEHPDFEFDTTGPTVLVKNPADGTVTDTKLPTGSLSDADKMMLGLQNKVEEIKAQGEKEIKVEGVEQTGRMAIAETRGWQPYMDSQGRAMAINQITGEVKSLEKPDGTPVENITRIPTPRSSYGGDANPTTAQTRAMMEGAQMLLPHIGELEAQAKDLDRRGLFGPIMSRVRDLAARVGTTGDPAEIQQQFDQFANSIQTDATLAKLGNDAATGQFLTGLALMASGAGRVHGGARGGGSIQMINYMKNMLSSSSTLPMFQGRLKSLDSYIRGYAAGPKAPDTAGSAVGSTSNSKIDQALDKLFPR